MNGLISVKIVPLELNSLVMELKSTSSQNNNISNLVPTRNAYREQPENTILRNEYIEGLKDAYNYYREQANYVELEKICFEFIPLLTEQKDWKRLSRVYNQLTVVNRIFGRYEEAIKNGIKALGYSKKEDSQEQTAQILNNLANIHKYIGDYKTALKYYLETKKLLENTKDTTFYKFRGIYIHNLAQIYAFLNYDKKATELYLQDFSLYVKEKNYARVGTALLGLSEIDLKHQKYHKAKKQIKKALHCWEKTSDKKGIAEAQFTLGKAYFLLGDYEPAITWFNEALTLFKPLNQHNGTVGSYTYLAKCFFHKEEIDLAIKFLEEAKKEAEKSNLPYEKLEILEYEHMILFHQKKYKQAYEKRSEYGTLREQLFNLSAQAKINEVQTQYEVDRKDLEYKKAKELNDYKTNLYTNITHEFRTPLTMIKTPIELLRGEKNPTVIEQRLRMIEQSADQMLRLVNQLLDIGKLEEGKMRVQLKYGSPVPMLGHVLRIFSEEAENKKIKFSYTLPSAEIQGEFDEDKIEKIISNLLSNAIKYTPERGAVKLSASIQGEELKLKIQDNGYGITEEELKHVFDRYYRSGNATQALGTGIGLSFVKEMVQLLGGNIVAESMVGKGTTFTVTLPFKRSAEEVFIEHTEEDEVKIISMLPATKTPEVKRKNTTKQKMLLIEDSSEIISLLSDIFHEDYDIYTAENGGSGVDIARKILPDIIVSDIMMPVMDGMEVCKNIKSNIETNHIPVILLTAKSLSMDRIEGLHAGADGYITKPFITEEVRATVKNLMESKKRIVEHFLKNMTADKKSENELSIDERFIKQASDFIHENLENEKLSVEDLAEHLAMSRFTLIRKFKSTLDTTPNDFIQNTRLHVAKSYLDKRMGSVSEIAYKAGFSSATYFSTSFKKLFGFTPKEYSGLSK